MEIVYYNSFFDDLNYYITTKLLIALIPIIYNIIPDKPNTTLH